MLFFIGKVYLKYTFTSCCFLLVKCLKYTAKGPNQCYTEIITS